MSAPIDLVLARLEGYKLRANGGHRWRSCCPAHGGSNPSALSIGEGEGGAVLLRCWQGCDVEQIAHALGLDLADLFPPRPEGHTSGRPARRRMLTAGQALDLLDSESILVMVCASDMARGLTLDDKTRERLCWSAARISVLRQEVSA
jgi:hypothetical protein